MKGGLRPSFLGNTLLLSNPFPSKSRIISVTTPPKERHRIIADLEVRVCVGKSCRRQGSMDALETLAGVAPPGVSVNSCGCLGRCGSGPNLVSLPAGVLVGHCGTPARAAAILMDLCGGDSDVASNSLDALALRKRAEDELQKGNFLEADNLLSKALDLKPHGGLHFIYLARSSARLGMGNYIKALEDAQEASMVAPLYSEAYISQGDAFLAMGQLSEADKSYSTSLRLNPSIRRSKSFKARISQLQEKVATMNT